MNMSQYVLTDISIQRFSLVPGFSGHRWGCGTVAQGQHGHREVLGRDRYVAPSPFVRSFNSISPSFSLSRSPLRDARSGSRNVLRLLLCAGFLRTLRPLLGAQRKRVRRSTVKTHLSLCFSCSL